MYREKLSGHKKCGSIHIKNQEEDNNLKSFLYQVSGMRTGFVDPFNCVNAFFVKRTLKRFSGL